MSEAASGPPQDVPLLSDVIYEDLSVGDRWGPFMEIVDRDTADGLRGQIGSRTSGEGVPLGALPLVTLRVMRRALQGIPPGGVLARLRFSIFDSIEADSPIEVRVWVSDQRRLAPGLFTTLAFSLAQRDAVPAVVEWTVIAPPRPAEETR